MESDVGRRAAGSDEHAVREFLRAMPELDLRRSLYGGSRSKKQGAFTGNETYVCGGYKHVGDYDIFCHLRTGHG